MNRRTFISKASLGLPLAAGFFCREDLPGSEHQALHFPAQLREQELNIREQPALWRRLGKGETDLDLWDHAYDFYIDNGESLTPIACLCALEKLCLPGSSFRYFMSRWNPQIWDDLLLACEAHHTYISWWVDSFGSELSGAPWDGPISSWPRFKPLPVVDALLADSRGALVWIHQIEALYNLFQPQLSSACIFRIAVNEKRAEAFEEARGMIFPDGRSLADIVHERMIFGVTKDLNARSASILIALLSGQFNGPMISKVKAAIPSTSISWSPEAGLR